MEHRQHTGRSLGRRAFVSAALAGAWALCGRPSPAVASEIRIAVTSGFAPAARDIGRRFTAQTGHTVAFEFGASGKLYAQIVGGSGFHVFLSADAERPVRAEAAGLTVPGTRATYAIGRLVLWSRDPNLIDGRGQVLHNKGGLPSLVIANPVTSRHGAAAVEVLETLGVYERLRPVLVTAADSQAVRDIVADGDAVAGFVPLSVMTGDTTGSRWLAPSELHAPIRHQAVLLLAGARDAAARSFMSFLKEKAARDIMTEYGYELPTPPIR